MVVAVQLVKVVQNSYHCSMGIVVLALAATEHSNSVIEIKKNSKFDENLQTQPKNEMKC